IGNLHRVVGGVALELEEPGGLIADETFPHGDLRSREMHREPLVTPRVAIGPVPTVADGAIESAIVRDVDVIAPSEAHARIVGDCGTQLLRRSELEVRANDLDDRAQCAFSFSRWRAALARLPHVAMSHQRRRPFFVLSKNTRWQRGSAQ